MKYLFDNNISPCFAEMLHALRCDVVALRKIMPPDTKDADFLGDLNRKYGIDVFLSSDKSQRTNAVEAALLQTSGCTSLYLNRFWSPLGFWEQARWLIRHWENIDGFCRGAAPGTCADIQQNGRCRMFSR